MVRQAWAERGEDMRDICSHSLDSVLWWKERQGGEETQAGEQSRLRAKGRDGHGEGQGER